MGHLLGGSVVDNAVWPRSAAARAPVPIAGHCRPMPLQRYSLKGGSGSVSVGPLGPGAHKVLFDPSLNLWRVLGVILMQFHPSYHLVGASPLPLDVGCLFLVGPNILLLMDVQQWVEILGFSQEKMSTHPSTLPSWTQPHTTPHINRKLN